MSENSFDYLPNRSYHSEETSPSQQLEDLIESREHSVLSTRGDLRCLKANKDTILLTEEGDFTCEEVMLVRAVDWLDKWEKAGKDLYRLEDPEAFKTFISSHYGPPEDVC
ncbi:MAG: hypothetical protein CL582_23400 [Alteromonadaceae bacterium]|nr:hypothetical protein [Alteromonadaceae bacterium]|tara:strand:- start:259 stop:588 length:330 start_codon:yes stop_codon:yes gene_type:complete